jgi:hypothetical protein
VERSNKKIYFMEIDKKNWPNLVLNELLIFNMILGVAYLMQ